MVPVVKQEDPSRASGQQEREKRHVGLGGVAGGTGEDQVVGPVVGRLTLAGSDVVQRDVVLRNGAAAVGADRSVLREQPVTVGLIRPAAGAGGGLGGGGGGGVLEVAREGFLGLRWRGFRGRSVG